MKGRREETPERELLARQRCRRNEEPMLLLSIVLAAVGVLFFAAHLFFPRAVPDFVSHRRHAAVYLSFIVIGSGYQVVYRLVAPRSGTATCARLQAGLINLAIIGGLVIAVLELIGPSPDLTAYVLGLTVGTFVYRGNRAAVIVGNGMAFALVAVTLLEVGGQLRDMLLLQSAIISGASVVVGLLLEREFERSVRTSELLRRSEERFRAFFERSDAAMLIIDPDELVLLEANAAASRFYGYPQKRLAGMEIARVYQPPQDQVRTELQGARRRERSFFVSRHRLAGGELRTVEVYASPIEHQGRSLLYAIVHDVTGHVETEEALQESNRLLTEATARAEAASRAKTEFLAHVSHELRTPLTAILGFSEILATEMTGPLNERQKRYTEAINESGQHLLALINDILDLAKADYRETRLETTMVDLPAVVEGSLTVVREKAARKGVRLTTDLPQPPGPMLRADKRRLRQILYNLLSNAVKFTPSGGLITVGVRPGKEEVALYVRDTGIGIPPEEQGRIFDDFYQAANNAQGETPGTGLGLALTRRFVELHGGSIRAESAGPGLGSCFTCVFPADGAPPGGY